MLQSGSMQSDVHPAQDIFPSRRAKFNLPVPTYTLPGNISPPLTPAHERMDDLFPASPSPSRDPVYSPDIWPEDDSLTNIEKIYLFSRSKLSVHRSYIACHFPDYLKDVDPEEAVDYVLPLLTELAIDEDGSVQEALASELPATLMWFFSNCKVIDFSEDTLQLEEHHSGNKYHSAPHPSVSIQMVTALLVTLLVSFRSNVAGATRRSIVNLLGQLSVASASVHPPNRLIRQELVSQVVVGVGKLDLLNSYDHSAPTKGTGIAQLSSDLFVNTSPTESALIADDKSTEQQNIESLQSTIDDIQSGVPAVIITRRSEEECPSVNAAFSSGISQSSEAEGIASMSGFQSDEAELGRFSAMSMIATMTASEQGNLPLSNLVSFLEEVQRVAEDQAYWVRSEAALAMGALAKVVPEELVYSTILPLHEFFVNDSHWRVRHSSLLALPNLLTRLPLDHRKTLAVSNLLRLYHDSIREVRIGVLEVLGETIHKFAPNCRYPTSSPPIELIDIFLGPPEHVEDEIERSNPSMSTSIEQSPSIGSLRSLFERKTNNYAKFNAARVNEEMKFESSQKDLICAYNYPAVVLTLGPQCWEGRFRDYYLSLSTYQSYKIQHTLIASLVEIASIIGPERTQQDLLPFWRKILYGEDSQMRIISIRHVRPLYGLLLEADRNVLICSLLEACDRRLLGWRERLEMAVIIPVLINRPERELISVFGKLIRDPAAAVRKKVVELIPRIIQSSLPECTALKLIAEVRSLASGVRHQFRSTFLDCFAVLMPIPLENLGFDIQTWFPELEALSRDIVSGVRIGVARLIFKICGTWYQSSGSRPLPVNSIIESLEQDSVSEVRAYIHSLSGSISLQTQDRVNVVKWTPLAEFSIPPPIFISHGISTSSGYFSGVSMSSTNSLQSSCEECFSDAEEIGIVEERPDHSGLDAGTNQLPGYPPTDIEEPTRDRKENVTDFDAEEDVHVGLIHHNELEIKGSPLIDGASHSTFVPLSKNCRSAAIKLLSVNINHEGSALNEIEPISNTPVSSQECERSCLLKATQSPAPAGDLFAGKALHVSGQPSASDAVVVNNISNFAGKERSSPCSRRKSLTTLSLCPDEPSPNLTQLSSPFEVSVMHDSIIP